jgi:hypothetical protein
MHHNIDYYSEEDEPEYTKTYPVSQGGYKPAFEDAWPLCGLSAHYVMQIAACRERLEGPSPTIVEETGLSQDHCQKQSLDIFSFPVHSRHVSRILLQVSSPEAH